jgi:S1-C subfamily serine protease
VADCGEPPELEVWVEDDGRTVTVTVTGEVDIATAPGLVVALSSGQTREAAAGSPAATAGLRVGDIITSIDGTAAVSTDQLIAVTLTKRAGDRVELGYERSGRHATTTITLAARP